VHLKTLLFRDKKTTRPTFLKNKMLQEFGEANVGLCPDKRKLKCQRPKGKKNCTLKLQKEAKMVAFRFTGPLQAFLSFNEGGLHLLNDPRDRIETSYESAAPTTGRLLRRWG
jgi:hypothetical protein